MDVSTTSMSGFPLDTDAVRDEDQSASNSLPPTRTVSAMIPLKPLCVSSTRSVRDVLSSCSAS